MPEGPSIVILREQVAAFTGCTILRVEGNSKIAMDRLDQTIFAGVGNIIKNEVLFRIRVQPLSTLGSLPSAKLRALVAEARQYSFDFLAWKRDYVLRKHWLVHNKGTCARCSLKLTRAHLGETNRRSFYCTACQKLYALTPALQPVRRKAVVAEASARVGRKVRHKISSARP